MPGWPQLSPSAPNGCQICKVCLLFQVGSDFLILANFTTFTLAFREIDKIFQNVSSESCNGLSNSLMVHLSISQKVLLFLQVVSAPLPDVVKENELSSMTTYSVPKISFSSISFQMNTEKKLDLLLMAYIPVCG